MGLLGSFLSHHLLSLLVAGLSLGFAASVLGQRRPSGSALAWLLVIFFVPYLGIPIYLVFGGRKYARRARSKSSIALPEPARDTGGHLLPGLLGERRIPAGTADGVEWLDEGTVAYEAFLRGIES